MSTTHLFFFNRRAANAKTFVVAYEATLASYFAVTQGVLQGVGLTPVSNDSSYITSFNLTDFDNDAEMDKAIKNWKALDPDVVVCK